MKPMILLCMGVALAFICGCADRKEAARRQETADSAATIWEAADAIEQGVPGVGPLKAIKDNASAIAAAQGIPYPPITPKAAP